MPAGTRVAARRVRLPATPAVTARPPVPAGPAAGRDMPGRGTRSSAAGPAPREGRQGNRGAPLRALAGRRRRPGAARHAAERAAGGRETTAGARRRPAAAAAGPPRVSRRRAAATGGCPSWGRTRLAWPSAAGTLAAAAYRVPDATCSVPAASPRAGAGCLARNPGSPGPRDRRPVPGTCCPGRNRAGRRHRRHRLRRGHGLACPGRARCPDDSPATSRTRLAVLTAPLVECRADAPPGQVRRVIGST